MKKLGFLIMITILLIIGYLFMDNHNINKSFSIDTYKINMEKYWSGTEISTNKEDIIALLKKSYTNKRNNVFYQNKLLTGVKAQGFIILNPFGIDKNGKVYLYGETLSGIDGKSIKLYPNNAFYISDKNGNYYIDGTNIKKINTIGKLKTFSGDFHQNFARDDKYLYNYGKIVSGANPDITRLFEDSFQYFISSGNIFFYFDIIPDADIKSFNVPPELDEDTIGYAQDKNKKYYLGKIIIN